MATTPDTTNTDGPGPEILDTGFVDYDKSDPFSGPFFQKISKRKNNERDAKILVTADHGQTGVGKTSCACYLAKVIDTSSDGWTADKATLDVPRFLQLWDELEPQSAAILDEAEQIDARRAMSQENVDASMAFQTRRVNQVFAFLTLPSPKEIDSRIERLADFWVNIETRGRARIYEKKIARIKKSVYYETLQTFRWPNMDKDPDYQALARMKDEFINDPDSDDNYIRKDKADSQLETAVKQAKKEYRDKMIRSLSDFGMSGSDIARLSAIEIKADMVRKVARGDA